MLLPEDFIARKRPGWERLTALIDQSQRSGLAALSADDLTELGRLYRSATSDLAVARRDYPTHRVNDYLNTLVARGHAAVYRSRASRSGSIKAFFTTTFPAAFRATWPYTLAAFLMFFIPALISFIAVWQDPGSAGTFYAGAEPVIDDIRNGREWWKSMNDEGNGAAASVIMTNNIRVAILAFAGGMLLGLLTLYVLVQNGLMLGVIAGASQALGFAPNLWGFVAAHGMIELSVIFIAGGAGLQLGWSVMRPGLLTRRAALERAAQRAGVLLLGCVPLLVIAGLIEGFISPSALPVWVKIAVSLGSGVLLYGYLLLSGRPRERRGVIRLPGSAGSARA